MLEYGFQMVPRCRVTTEPPIRVERGKVRTAAALRPIAVWAQQLGLARPLSLVEIPGGKIGPPAGNDLIGVHGIAIRSRFGVL